MVEQLLKSCRGYVESKDNEYSQTPLLWAAENGHVTVVGLLLKEADIEALNKRGRTTLYLAIKRRHSAVAQLLVDREFNVEAKDSLRRTALHRAVELGHEEVVRLLLKGCRRCSGRPKGGMGAVVQQLLERNA